jgi:hypothetical protein
MGVFAAPAVETTPIPANPKPDFSKMQFLNGAWTCSVKSSRRPAAFTVTSTTSMSPDGYWQIVRATSHKVPWNPVDIHSVDYITYDASTSRWVDVGYDDQGGYVFNTSSGWNGNSITWNANAYPKTNATATNNPTVTTKISSTKTTSRNTFTEPSGRLITVTSSCTKS